MRRKAKKTIGNNALRMLLVLFVVIAAGICSRFFYQLMLIQGDSMKPAYHNMQLVILNKADRHFQPGDVIAFQCEGLNSVLVKRIIAGDGDTVYIRHGTLYVNNLPSDVYPPETFSYAGILAETVQLEKDDYLVIGDNIPESKDSRYPEVGIVKTGTIIGKVCR